MIGTGALGSLYGAILQRGGATVKVQARSDHETILRQGIRIESQTGLGDWVFYPDEVLRPGELPNEAPDLILMAIKVTPQTPRIRILQSLYPGRDCALVLLSNGIEVEREIAEAFPENPILGAVAFVSATRIHPGHIQHHAYGHLLIGRYPGGSCKIADRLALHLIEGGGSAESTAAIQSVRWQKNLWNASFSAISVLSGGCDTSIILGSEEELVRSIMREVHEIAFKEGFPLPWSMIEKQIEGTHRMPPYHPSMLLDDRAGRPLEIEVILGHAIRRARIHNMSTPRLDTLYALLKFRCLRDDQDCFQGRP